MTIEERLAAVERELEHQREVRKLRDIADDLTAGRVDRVGDQLEETKRVLPVLRGAIKEMEEAFVVVGHLQSRQAALLKDHAEWLVTHDRVMRETDERITKLVSAIGDLLRRNGSA